MFARREGFKEYISKFPLVSLLIGSNLLIYALTLLPEVGETITYAFIGWNELLRAGEWWRLVTPMFLHISFAHILFNMFSLYLFGPELEMLAGKMRFAAIYLLSGLIGNAAMFWFQGDNPYLGASGAIFGVLGAYAGLVHYTKRAMPQLRALILPLIGINLVMTFLMPNIGTYGHLGGLIAGYLLGLYYFSPKRINRFRSGSRS